MTSFVRALSIAMLAVAGCSANPGGGSADPCEMHVVYSCDGADGETCDEVYTASARAELEPICNRLGDFSSTSQCSTSLQCCFFAMGGYGDGAQVHCVSTRVDSNYRSYCTSHGGMYCDR